MLFTLPTTFNQGIQGTADQFVDDVYAPEIDNCCVANLGNSPAITCDSRLAFVNFRHISVHPELIRGSLILRMAGIFALVLACLFFNDAQAAGDNSGLITAMTYNIRVGAGTAQWGESPYKLKDNANLDLQPVAAAIESVDADVVGLQEVYGQQQAEQLGQLLSMAVAYVPHGQGKHGGWWGVALLSRFKSSPA